jgi:hypothetical protein
MDTQIRPGYHPTKTPYEQIYGKAPNMERLFPYRLAQLVTVTGLTAHNVKTDHHLAGAACYTLHTDKQHGTWCYCPHPDVERAYLRDHTNIQPLQFKDIPNVHIGHYLPNQSTHPTYPAGSILKFIDKNIDMLRTPEILTLGEKDITTPMQVDTEQKMPIDIPISTPRTSDSQNRT